MCQVSRTRLLLLCACYSLMFFGLMFVLVPDLFGPVTTMPLMETAATILLSTVCFLSFLGIFAPLKMLPILLFEIIWKIIWTLSVAIPNLVTGTLSSENIGMLWNCALALPFLFIFPWEYAIETYRNSLAPWAKKGM